MKKFLITITLFGCVALQSASAQKKESARSKRKAESSEVSVKARYHCPDCLDQFSTSEEVAEHLRLVHPIVTASVRHKPARREKRMRFSAEEEQICAVDSAADYDRSCCDIFHPKYYPEVLSWGRYLTKEAIDGEAERRVGPMPDLDDDQAIQDYYQNLAYQKALIHHKLLIEDEDERTGEVFARLRFKLRGEEPEELVIVD